MIALDVPPKLILPDHYQANRPAIIRPVGDLARYFPVELDRKQRRAIVAELVKLGAVDDRAKASKLIEAAVPFGMFGGKVFTATYSNVYSNTASATTYTFNSVVCSPGSLLLVGAGAAESGGNRQVASGTIDGLAASLLTTVNNNDWHPTGFISRVTTGATTTVTITFTGGVLQCVIFVWILDGYNSATPVAATSVNSIDEGGGSGTTSTTLTTNVSAGGRVFYVGAAKSSTVNRIWSSATERHESTIDTRKFAAADKFSATAITPHTETITGLSNGFGHSAVSFR